MLKNIAIIGAGPVGSYAAYLLSKKGFKVSLFDKKKASQIGLPIQCAGIFPYEIRKFLHLDKSFHINTTYYAQINSPYHYQTTFHKTEYIFDRQKLDQYLLQQAIKHGTVFHPQHKLIEINRNQNQKHNLVFKQNNSVKIFSPDIIIGADGPLSLVYQYLNPNLKKRFYYGIQATIKGNFNPETHRTFFGNKICPCFFAWLIPESKNKARIGLATKENPSKYFHKFLTCLDIKQSQIMEKQGGIIPIFNSQTTLHKNNVFLLGDAASHVKPTTLGGITPSFQEAHNLVKTLEKKQPYRPNIKNLKLHHFIRKTLNKFSDRDYHKFIRLLSKPKNKKIIETYSRENPKKLIKKLLLKEPRFLLFGKYLF